MINDPALHNALPDVHGLGKSISDPVLGEVQHLTSACTPIPGNVDRV